MTRIIPGGQKKDDRKLGNQEKAGITCKSNIARSFLRPLVVSSRLKEEDTEIQRRIKGYKLNFN